MMQSRTKHGILPAFIGGVVLLISLMLLTIIARSPFTHANLNLSFNPNYTRTIQTFVSAPIPLEGERPAVPLANDQVERGKQLFVTNGCASCHGLDGHGGVIGPSIANMTADTLRSVTNDGPQGMPAYAPNALSRADLEAIAAFLGKNGK